MATTFIDEFPPLIREFANDKEVIQGCSKKTVTEYLFDLRTFCRYIYAKKNDMPTEGEEFTNINISHLDMDFFESITTSDIYDFLAYTSRERENQPKARARKLSAIKQFYKHCTVKRMYFKNNPAQNIETPKFNKTLPKYLTYDECIKLYNAVIDDKLSKTKERDYCILTLFLNCGIRLSELTGINVTDLDNDLKSMRVTGKGNKERIVYLNDSCRDAINTYLPIRINSHPKNSRERAFFLSGQGQRISVKTVQWMVKKYLNAAGLQNRKLSTHKLRHTAATLMYQSGKVDIRVLKDILGHEQLNTTQIYTHVTDANMEQAMNNNPLAEIMIKPEKLRPLETDESNGEE